MSDLSHLRLEHTALTLDYTYAGPTPRGAVFRLPARNRIPHAQRLLSEIQAVRSQVDAARRSYPTSEEIDGYPLTVRSDAGYELKLESLDRQRDGMELLSVHKDGQTTVASVFVRRDKLVSFLRLIERYKTEDHARSHRPKNQDLVESIASISLAIIRDLWVEPATVALPPPDQAVWWEVWLRTTTGQPADILAHFRSKALGVGLSVSERSSQFPERIVVLVWGSSRQLGESVDVLAYIAELRKAKEVPTPYLDLSPRDQKEFIEEAVGRLVKPSLDAFAVCLLDTGVNRNHPLLAPALEIADAQAVDPAWGSADHDSHQHGTGMAGVALYQCLTEVFASGGPLQLRHRLESVKLLPPPPGANAPQVYGSVMQQAVSKAEIQAPNRNRAICMAVTSDDTDQGQPTSWSAAVDQMCSGELDGAPKLMFISAGNYHAVLENAGYVYPVWNLQYAGIQDPAQAWNAITVGAYTEKVSIQDKTYAGWQPVASSGDLSPASRTSVSWPPENQKEWPYKPDIVTEGGNYIRHGNIIDTCPDLELLTTHMGLTGHLLATMRDTSAATAGAARMAAILWSHYPTLRPETIRALLIHSAQWTDGMLASCPGELRKDVQRRLRCFGYGVPQLHRAIYSAQNAATLICEGELQPYHKHDGEHKTYQMDLHQIPWPVEVLQQLGETSVTMHVTLSYFIQPSPGRRGWGDKHRFQSHGLRFEVNRPTEDMEQFKRRVSSALWDDDGRPSNVPETCPWVIGTQNRTRGSVHSDWWTGVAADLARCNTLAVFPVTGWWKERPHLGRINNKARYSLVISLETPAVDVDLYTPIVNLATVSTELVV